MNTEDTVVTKALVVGVIKSHLETTFRYFADHPMGDHFAMLNRAMYAYQRAKFLPEDKLVPMLIDVGVGNWISVLFKDVKSASTD